MFRKFAFLAVVAAAFVASGFAASAGAATPIEQFRSDTYNGVQNAYYGYLYCYNARQAALANGLSDADNGYALYYAEQYALYSYQYGYYALTLEYADYAVAAADTANAAWNYEYGVFNYLYTQLYPQYPQVYVIMEPSMYGYQFMLYAEIYFTYAYAAVQ